MVVSTESFLESMIISLSRVIFVRMVNRNVENKYNLVKKLKMLKIWSFALQYIPNHLFCSMQIDDIHVSVF